MLETSYQELKAITDAVYAGIKNKWAKEVIDLLKKYNIKIRQKDGKLHSVNISIPKSRDKCILVGLRYVKNDKTLTEDHFLFEENKRILAFYKGRLEKVLLEYKNSHKQQEV
ncbi:MAG: hypothetical protein HW400_781 [Candidatus Levybacteria bacterium]|nr:hypothetical protein [Candidatus Levybacteria bacterium]